MPRACSAAAGGMRRCRGIVVLLQEGSGVAGVPWCCCRKGEALSGPRTSAAGGFAFLIDSINSGPIFFNVPSVETILSLYALEFLSLIQSHTKQW